MSSIKRRNFVAKTMYKYNRSAVFGKTNKQRRCNDRIATKRYYEETA
jgi:hypothetical protein